ncbi:MAG: glycerol-3-phosphate 1-O-acyltransferase [Verrucomicrobia bacterium]|nr:MAG: glycerol-3-phosphate 1-O-acyltransferase [Verrucomicrobiota bacterium]
MNAWLNFIGWLAGAYLVGAIPFGLLIGRLKGVDIRTVGSKNIGATNVFRSVGKGWGILTFTLDAMKGLVPVLVFPMLGKADIPVFQGLENSFGLLCGVAAILGHNFPVYLKFKGGKGVATSAGVLIGVAPAAVGVGVLGWLVLFLTSRYVSFASMGAALVVPAAGWWLYRGQELLTPIVLTLLGLLVVFRHKANIQRLMTGTESRFQFGKKEAANRTQQTGGSIQNTGGER